MPSRHYLGAILLDAGRPRGAETAAVMARFEEAWANADHKLASARY